MFAIGIIGSLILFCIAGFHVYWLFGGKVGTDRYINPGKDGRRIHISKPVMCATALFFIAAACIPLAALQIIHLPLPGWVMSTILITGIVILLIRGIGGLIWSLHQSKPRDIFHRWNIGLYTWVCLALALSFGACLFSLQ